MALLDIFRKKSSSSVAKDRLKLLLVSERADCSPEIMELIKNDIIKVISKYLEIDTDGLDIQINKTELEGEKLGSPALFANIPIKGKRNLENEDNNLVEINGDLVPKNASNNKRNNKFKK